MPKACSQRAERYLPGPGVSPASVSEYPKGYSETLLAADYRNGEILYIDLKKLKCSFIGVENVYRNF